MVDVNKLIKSMNVAKIKNTKPQRIIKCYQISLKHSRTAIFNLMNLIEKERIDVPFIQEQYTVHNRVVAITEMYRIFIPSVGRCRTATVATDDRIGVLLIREATEKYHVSSRINT